MSIQDQIDRITNEVGTQNGLIDQVEEILQEKLPDGEFEGEQIADDGKLETNTRKLENLLDLAKTVPIVVQSDWEQQDETQLDYIKNKPEVTTEVIENSESLITSGGVHQALKNFDGGTSVQFIIWEDDD